MSKARLSQADALKSLRETIKPGDVIWYSLHKWNSQSTTGQYQLLILRVDKRGEVRPLYVTRFICSLSGWRIVEGADGGDIASGITHGDLTSGLHDLSRLIHGNNLEFLPPRTPKQWRKAGYTFRYDRL